MKHSLLTDVLKPAEQIKDLVEVATKQQRTIAICFTSNFNNM
jgi:hypothetical protein